MRSRIYSTCLYTLLLAVTVVSGSFAPRIKTTPTDDDYIVVHAGDTFKLECESSSPVNWTCPSCNISISKANSTLNETYWETPNSNYSYSSAIEIYNAHFLDTGYYTCYQEGEPIHKNDASSKIYVFVSDPLNLLVKEDIMVIANEYQTTTIPCRPTSPDVSVTLFDDNEEIINLPHDPKLGFIISSAHIIDSQSYLCSAEYGNASDNHEFHLNVVPATDHVMPPTIELDAGNQQGHVEVGSTFTLHCSLTTAIDIKFRLFWNTPNDIARHEGRLTINETTSSTYTYNDRTEQKGVRTLLIENATSADEGNYTCIVQDHNELQNHDVYHIKVFEKDAGYIKISNDAYENQDMDPYNVGSGTVVWVINFKAYPQPSVTWFDPYNKEINSMSDKFQVENKANQSILRILQIDLEQAGTYKLVLRNSNEEKEVKKMLFVKGKPQITGIFANATELNANQKQYTVRCEVLANPVADVECTFNKCMSLTDCTTLGQPLSLVKKDNISSQYGRSYSTDLSTEESGIVKCSAKNDFGISYGEMKFFVNDVPGGFGLLPKPETAMYQQMVLTCRASKFLFSENRLEWVKDGRKLSGEYIVSKADTKYSYGSSLKVEKLSKKHSGDYKCEINDPDRPESETLNIIVEDLVNPVITSNMNNSETIVDRDSDLMLTCSATGVPQPKIVWYKDNRIFGNMNSTRIQFKDGNQVLHLQFLGMDDNGRYKCITTNAAGSVERYMDVKVKGTTQLSAGIISLIVGLIVILCVLFVVLCIKIRKERRINRELKFAGLDQFEKGATECINPELCVDEQAELLPYDKRWEFPRDNLKLGKQLGSGAFGVVMKAEAINIIEGEPISTVAVKMVKRNADYTYIKALASELKIMIHLGQHLNVVNLLGACTKNLMKRELLVIVEYCCFGNLQNYLLRHRQNFIDQKVGDAIDVTVGSEEIARSMAEYRKAREAHEEATRITYTSLKFQNSDGCSSPQPDSSMRHPSFSSNPSSYQWDTTNTLSTDASGQHSGTTDDPLNSNNQPAWRSNYRGDYKRTMLRPICTQDLLCWAFQVARGMEYLVSRKVLHGDLAARNILLAEDNVVKICDFGLAKSMYKSDNYKKKGDGPLPVKWMAIESIQDRVFSTQSDVWSFGIVMWEFFSLARTPYPGMEADEKLFNKLMDGYRMEKPPYATSSIYTLMQDCWRGKPERRPSFTTLGEQLGSMLEESVRIHYMDLNTPYLMMNNQDGSIEVEDYLAMMSAPTYCNEVARQKTPVNDYVNIPQVGAAEGDGTDYLSMSPKNDPDSPLTEEGGYLRMNIGSPTRSVLFSPAPQSLAFQFPSSPTKLTPTEKQGADVGELKPMLNNSSSPHYNMMPKNLPIREESPVQSPSYTNLPPKNAVDDDKFGDGLQVLVSPSFENPSYQFLGQDSGRKRGYSEASSSGFHSERDSMGHSPKQDDESRASPPHYEEATEMTNSVLV